MVPLEGFCQIASGFGLMTEVDWSTLFKTFYEVVRIKVAVRNAEKIPSERLYEIDKKLFFISITVEGENNNGPEKKGDDGDGGGDDGKDNDEEADDLDDLPEDVDKPVEKDKPARNSEKTPVTKPSQKSRGKTVSLDLNQVDHWDQERLLVASMNFDKDKLMTAFDQKRLEQQHIIDDRTASATTVEEKCLDDCVGQLSPEQLDVYTVGLNLTADSSKVPQVVSLEGCALSQTFQTPEAIFKQNSDCQVVGNILYQLINDESHHSKWEEFRRMTKSGTMIEECSNLLKRMELDDSEGEEDSYVIENENHEEDVLSLGELISQEKTVQMETVQEKETKKMQKRKLGPILRMDRPRRFPGDGRTMLQKAQDLKKAKNEGQGTFQKT